MNCLGNNQNQIYKVISFDSNRQDEFWIIWLEQLAGDEIKIVRLRCKHYFHQTCIDQWVKQSQTCPTWRKDIVSGPDDFDEEEEVSILDQVERPIGIENIHPVLQPQNSAANIQSVEYLRWLRPADTSGI